jgi:ribA/ribD-fused uncharacterized protein
MTTTDTHVYFWNGPFSNWHRCLLKDPTDQSLCFGSSEQAFMFYKAIFFQDVATAGRIEKELNPAKAKELGRGIKGYDEKLWECVRLGFMTYCCYMKYSQNDELKAILLGTGDRVLVEASPYDKTWGIGIGEEDAVAGKLWQGRNLLGQALMDVRRMLA